MAYDSVDEPHIIYCITNTVNGKVYVGYTKRTLEKRWDGHVKDSQREGKASYDRVLMAAIRKYGVESFVMEKIDDADNAWDAGEKEKFWIKELGAKGKNGYNMTDGGEGVKGWEMSEERRKQISIQNSGSNNYWYGVFTNQSPHYGTTLSETHKEKLKTNNSNNKSLTINGVEYRSMTYASEVFGVSRVSVARLVDWEKQVEVIQHERITYKGVLYYGVKNAAKLLGTSAYLLKRDPDMSYVKTSWTFYEFLQYLVEMKKKIRAVEYEGVKYRSVRELCEAKFLDKDKVLRMIRDGEIVEIDYEVYKPSPNSIPVKFCEKTFSSKSQLMDYFKISNKEFNRLLDSGEIEEAE